MITLLIGENSFEVQQAIRQLSEAFSGETERYNGSELTIEQLPDLLMGISLFSEKRLIVVRDLAANKYVWEALPNWIERVSDDIHLVLVEPKPDKRTKTYKALHKHAEVHEYTPWSDRDTAKAEKWIMTQAAEYELALTPALARLLVARVGVNQWELDHALEKLSALDAIDETTIRTVIDAAPSENVFELFEAALSGDVDQVHAMIRVLSLSEDPYQLFGLLSGQAFQLMALAAARDTDDVAKDMGVHPFVLSKLRPHVSRLGLRGAARIITRVEEADEAIKSSALTPWHAIERALIGIRA